MENFTSGTGFIGQCINDIEVDNDASIKVILSNGASITIPPGGFFTEPGSEFWWIQKRCMTSFTDVIPISTDTGINWLWT